MDNKLTQLTRTLYDEGLAKGRDEGEKILKEAEARARQIVKEAEVRAEDIIAKAENAAEELRERTLNEVRSAGRRAVALIKDEIADLIVAKAISGPVHAVGMDAGFIKEMLLEIAGNQGVAGGVSVEALLPADKRETFDAVFAKSTDELLKAGVEVGYSPAVKSGFRVVPKSGGYYIGFEDENFEALLGGYLRERAREILYGE